MNNENTKPSKNEISSTIEDLTLNEITSESVKGGSGKYLLDLGSIKGE